MELKLILLLIIAHLLSDFIIQTKNKRDSAGDVTFNYYHLIVVGITSYLLSFDIGFWKAAILLTIIHLITEKWKQFFKERNKNLFFIEQAIYLASIIVIVFVHSKLFGINLLIDIGLKPIAIITGFIFCTKPSNIIIKYLLKGFSIQTPEENSKEPGKQSLPNAGKLIGIVERFLALALIIMDQYEAVGLIIAAKSILRFNNEKKSEYVLVGTLLSFALAIFSGILINLINYR